MRQEASKTSFWFLKKLYIREKHVVNIFSFNKFW